MTFQSLFSLNKVIRLFDVTNRINFIAVLYYCSLIFDQTLYPAVSVDHFFILIQFSTCLRVGVLCLIFGKPEDLKRNVLPTNEDFLKHYLHLKHESNKEKPTDLISKIADSVIQIWETNLVTCANPVKTPCDWTPQEKNSIFMLDIYANKKLFGMLQIRWNSQNCEGITNHYVQRINLKKSIGRKEPKTLS